MDERVKDGLSPSWNEQNSSVSNGHLCTVHSPTSIIVYSTTLNLNRMKNGDSSIAPSLQKDKCVA